MKTGVHSLAVIVVNYGATALLEQNLARISEGGLDARFVVVDNFSTVQERARVTQACERYGWTLVAPAGNDGFGAGVNVGVADARAAGCEYFLLLNPDAWIHPDSVRAMNRQCREDLDAMICPRIETTHGIVVYKGSQVSRRTGRIKGFGPFADAAGSELRLDGNVPAQLSGPTQGWLTGACLMAHRDLFDRIGGFDESYFLYWEDVDLSARAEAAGARLIVRLDLAAVHDEGGTQEQGRGKARSETYYYFNCRNRLLFAVRNLPRRDVLRWVLHTPAESWQILMRGGRRQLLQSPRPLWASVRGSFAGLVLVASLFGRRYSRKE